jgi:tetratricopeptide (TPR) repeat protein
MDGRYEEALSTLKSAVSVAPDNAEALFYLGRAQMELNQLQDAENTFETLLKNPPVSKQVDYFIGKTYGLQGNLADAHYHLGLYYLNQREYQSAHIQLTKALELTQDSERRQKIENLLKQAQAMLSKARKRSG